MLLLSPTAGEFNEDDNPNIGNGFINIVDIYCGNINRYKTIATSSSLLHLLLFKIYVYTLIPSKIDITTTTTLILLKTNKSSSITINSYRIRTMLFKNSELDYSMYYTLSYRNSKTKVIRGFGKTISIASPVATLFFFFFLFYAYSFLFILEKVHIRDKPNNSRPSWYYFSPLF